MQYGKMLKSNTLDMSWYDKLKGGAAGETALPEEEDPLGEGTEETEGEAAGEVRLLTLTTPHTTSNTPSTHTKLTQQQIGIGATCGSH